MGIQKEWNPIDLLAPSGIPRSGIVLGFLIETLCSYAEKNVQQSLFLGNQEKKYYFQKHFMCQ
jgi:hypothetical protein